MPNMIECWERLTVEDRQILSERLGIPLVLLPFKPVERCLGEAQWRLAVWANAEHSHGERMQRFWRRMIGVLTETLEAGNATPV